MRPVRPTRLRGRATSIGLCVGVVVSLAVPLLGPGPAAATAVAAGSGSAAGPVAGTRSRLRTDLHRFVGNRSLHHGRSHGVRVRHGSLRLGKPAGVRRLADRYGSAPPRRYAYGTWTSPWVHARHRFRELVPSWSATTRAGTLLQVDVRVRATAGRTGSWDRLARWASGPLTGFHRASPGAQRDDIAGVAVDTVRTDRAANRWRVRLTLYRRAGTGRTPVVAAVGATTSTRAPDSVPTSRPHRNLGRVVGVPAYSQLVHRGHYPRWGGGGTAWCSPTSVAMVLASWGDGPTRRQYRWVSKRHRDPWVDHAARMSYDHRYRGTGNWSFSAAYAATFGLDAFVVRLGSLRAAERYLARGIPLVLSIAFDTGELDGAPISSSSGHLLVLRGFTGRGRPVVNDPAAASNAGVRRVYSRGQLEEAWLTASAGTAYVVRPQRVALPR